MFPSSPILLGVLIALNASSFMRTLHGLYYRDASRIRKLVRERRIVGFDYYKRFDSLLAPMPFLLCWCEIAAAVLFFRYTGYHPLAGLLCAVIAAGRMRALQEIGHNALHLAYCPSKDFQWALSNIFFQFPMFKRDMNSRLIVHVRQHHPHANVPGKDPNYERVRAGGIRPGIGRAGFFMALFRPLSPKGIAETAITYAKAAFFENSGPRLALLRAACIAGTVAVFVALGGWRGLLLGYVIPLLTLYPLFAWISLLTEHRWHAPLAEGRDRRLHDLDHGRPTDFNGFFGPVLRYLIFPFSDAYHLAHHFYPFLRPEYLRVVDAELKSMDPAYTRHLSDGLILPQDGQPTALSELYDRVVTAPPRGAASGMLQGVTE